MSIPLPVREPKSARAATTKASRSSLASEYGRLPAAQNAIYQKRDFFAAGHPRIQCCPKSLRMDSASGNDLSPGPRKFDKSKPHPASNTKNFHGIPEPHPARGERASTCKGRERSGSGARRSLDYPRELAAEERGVRRFVADISEEGRLRGGIDSERSPQTR
jgi:hypothetical protein